MKPKSLAPKVAIFVLAFLSLQLQSSAAPLLEARTIRPLHFHPDGRDFVVENGLEFFNRPLYGPNNGFRVDGGDRPEFSLYLPGRGGNLRLGIQVADETKWLSDAAHIVARYRPGSMLYEISDPLLSGSPIQISAMPIHNAEGLIVRIERIGKAQDLKLIWAFGGASGERGTRDGDIGTERQPVSQYFQLRPEACQGNSFAIESNKFTLTSKPAAIVGLAPTGAQLAVADANHWASAKDLLASIAKAGAAPVVPVVVGQYTLAVNQPAYLLLQRISRPGDDRGELGTYLAVRQETPQKAPDATTQSTVISDASSLPAIFQDAEKHRQSIADKIVVDTPDAYINAAGSAICIAADAVWDERQTAFMHGAVAWRSKLLGWRGPYSADELGWHDRATRDMTMWSGKQNVSMIPDQRPGLDPSVNLSRDEPALHSNGDISNSHYDMNLVYIDAVFRHILWTGDMEFARKMWPVIERHLAWERRLFRRTYGPENLPLYEAYCCIWASDDVQYSGGGATHATAYNFYHNLMAARLAKLLNHDAAPYEKEAALIAKAMHEQLWLKDRGWYGECKDFLGKQLVHPSPATWTFYHTVDSLAASPMEAWQMTRFIDTQIAHIPIRGAGVPEEGNFTLPTTNWMFYTWSTNNVVMAESAHTALGYWQANRADEAFKLFKGCVLDSMYQGLCPGNAGMCTYFDVARGESQRDFADAVGMDSRAMVEGLFGVRPDAMGGELRVCPGFPAGWDRASIKHPDFNFTFARHGTTESYSVVSNFAVPLSLRLQIPVLGDTVQSVMINGRAANWRAMEDSVGTPRIEIAAPAEQRFDVVIAWSGSAPAVAQTPAVAALGSELVANFSGAKVLAVEDPQLALVQPKLQAGEVRGIVAGTIGHRMVFAKLQQGGLTWWSPVMFEIRPRYELVDAGGQDSNHASVRFRNNTMNAVALSGETVPAMSWSAPDDITKGKLPGTNVVTMILTSGDQVRETITNWKLDATPILNRLESVEMSKTFNDQVTHIFEPNKYLSPRSPFCSLSMPSQGIGSWCRPTATATIDDTGLRKASDQHQGKFILPNGIFFQTPGVGNAKNIAFASQWDNYPRQISVPLSGRASHVYLLMAGSTNWMQSRLENGRVVVTYTDGSNDTLVLENPTNWWPIEEDYMIDDYAFARPQPLPIRVDLRSGNVRVLDMASFKGHGGKINGGAATVLDLPLNSKLDLKSLEVSATANEVVLGLMGATLVRP